MTRRSYHHRRGRGRPSPVRRHHKRSLATELLLGSAVVGFIAWQVVPDLRSSWQVATRPPEEIKALEQSVYYPNCDAARAAGAAPIHVGSPGYREPLDADLDGVACEPYRY